MASTVIGKLAVEIAANTAQFTKGLNSANASFSKFAGSLKNVAAGIGIAFGVREVANFGFEVIKLAGEAEGVKTAFDRLANSKKVLSDLKDATGNTVSELALMKNAIQANNFQIPIENLASLFKFATLRAQQTGQSVNYLVDSIILGIGRKSPLILDNLGISAIRLKEKLHGVGTETATIGDVAKAVGTIATEELGKMAGFSDNASTQIQQLEASWENLKVSIGKAASEQGSFFSDLIKGTTTILNQASGNIEAVSKGFSENLAKAFAGEDVGLSIEFIISRLKELRREAQQPLKFDFSGLAQQFKLTGDQADKLFAALNDVNKTLSIQEEVVDNIQNINLSKGYNDLTKAAKDYENQIYNLILQDRILIAQDERIAGGSKNVQNILASEIAQAKERIDQYNKLTYVISEYIKTLKGLPPPPGVIDSLKLLKDKVKELNTQFEEQTDRTDKARLQNIGNEIIATQELIDKIEQLRKSRAKSGDLAINNSNLFDTVEGAVVSTPGQFAKGPKSGSDFLNANKFDLKKTTDDALKNLKTFEQEATPIATKIKGAFIDLGNVAGGAISELAFSFGEAAAGVGNFGTAILKAVVAFARQLGEILISIGTAMLAARKLITNPGLAIAAGIALVALAGAASAAISKSQQNFNNSGGGISSAASTVPTSGRGFDSTTAQPIRVEVTGVVKGKDLYVVGRNYDNGRSNTNTING